MHGHLHFQSLDVVGLRRPPEPSSLSQVQIQSHVELWCNVDLHLHYLHERLHESALGRVEAASGVRTRGRSPYSTAQGNPHISSHPARIAERISKRRGDRELGFGFHPQVLPRRIDVEEHMASLGSHDEVECAVNQSERLLQRVNLRFDIGRKRDACRQRCP